MLMWLSAVWACSLEEGCAHSVVATPSFTLALHAGAGCPQATKQRPGSSYDVGCPEPRGMFNSILGFHPRDAGYSLPGVTVHHKCFHTLLNVCALLKTLH